MLSSSCTSRCPKYLKTSTRSKPRHPDEQRTAAGGPVPRLPPPPAASSAQPPPDTPSYILLKNCHSQNIVKTNQSSYQHPLIVEVPPSAGHSDQHRTFLLPKEQIVTSYWWRRIYRWPSRRPCGLPRPLRHGRQQKTTQIRFCYRGISTSSQNQRQKLHRHHELHLRFALAPPPYPLSTYPPGRE
jgi:hypothetical protein